jgi:hypothetical protein
MQVGISPEDIDGFAIGRSGLRKPAAKYLDIGIKLSAAVRNPDAGRPEEHT